MGDYKPRPNVVVTWTGEHLEILSTSGERGPHGKRFFGVDRCAARLKRRGFRIERTGAPGRQLAVPVTDEARAAVLQEFKVGEPVEAAF